MIASRTDSGPEPAASHTLLPLDRYDVVVIASSGGKDSIACTAKMLDLVPREKIRWWHQCVDGGPDDPEFMDWPCTPAYVRAVGDALGIRTLFQWKEGGFLREMLREEARTAPTTFECEDGTTRTAGGVRGKLGTRLKFPQVSADLRVRWCSPYTKIDVAALALNNDPFYRDKTVLLVTGERREESAARSRYDEVVEHQSSKASRRVDQWRAVIDWSEVQVWDAMRRLRVNPHPCYRLGWGRCSCLTCIFGEDDQWASVRDLSPTWFERIASYEQRFGLTIHRTRSIGERADRGTSFVPDDPALRALALGRTYPADRALAAEWVMPLGAFRRAGGPT